MHITMVLEPA